MRNPLLVPDLRELIRAGEADALRDFFSDHHPAQVAEMIEDLGPEEGEAVLGLLAGRQRAEVFSYLSSEHQVSTVERMNPAEAAALLHLMSHDERADLVKKLDEEHVDRILPHLAQAERDDIRRLASYEPGTAGAVMTTDYVTLPPHLTVREALERLRHDAPDRETIYYSYVVDPQRKLIGFVSLKTLILARPLARIEDIMQRDVIVARVDEDQEAVARQIGKYDLIAIPVVDAEDMLLGIITHDDALDILRKEQTEDMLAFGGVSRDSEADEESYWKGRIVEAMQRRIGWLLMLFLAGTITRYVVTYFEWVGESLRTIEHLRTIKLDAFIPLLIGTGGNAGSQTVGTIIRGLALGEIQPADTVRVVVRETLTGLLLGVVMGCLGFVFTWLVFGHSPGFGLVIGLALLGICVWANVIGALVPLMAKRFNIDPALVSAPLISTLVDATGLCIFYCVAIVLLLKLNV
jgi:magnesium transporter